MLKLKTGSKTGYDPLTCDPNRPDPVKIADPETRFYLPGK